MGPVHSGAHLRRTGRRTGVRAKAPILACVSIRARSQTQEPTGCRIIPTALRRRQGYRGRTRSVGGEGVGTQGEGRGEGRPPGRSGGCVGRASAGWGRRWSGLRPAAPGMGTEKQGTQGPSRGRRCSEGRSAATDGKASIQTHAADSQAAIGDVTCSKAEPGRNRTARNDASLSIYQGAH